MCGSLAISPSLSLPMLFNVLLFCSRELWIIFFSLLFQEASRFTAITFPLSQIQTSPASFQQKPRLTSTLGITGIVGNHFTGIRGALSVCSGLDWGLLGHTCSHSCHSPYCVGSLLGARIIHCTGLLSIPVLDPR